MFKKLKQKIKNLNKTTEKTTIIKRTPAKIDFFKSTPGIEKKVKKKLSRDYGSKT